MPAEITLELIYEKLCDLEKKLDTHEDRTAGRLAALAMNTLEIKEQIKELMEREQVSV